MSKALACCVLAQVTLGLPRVLVPSRVFGAIWFPVNNTDFRKEEFGSAASFPNRISCLRSIIDDKDRTPAVSSTLILLMCDSIECCILQIARRHRQWKASMRCLSDCRNASHSKEYNSLEITQDMYICILRCFVMLACFHILWIFRKVALASPSLWLMDGVARPEHVRSEHR